MSSRKGRPFDPTCKSVKECFDNVFYLTPPYQRRYAWTEKEVTDLFTDIHDASIRRDIEPYLLGSIVIVPEKGHLSPNLLIDGQQRITTIALLIAIARKHFNYPDRRYDSLLFKTQVDGSQRHLITHGNKEVRELFQCLVKGDRVVKKSEVGAGASKMMIAYTTLDELFSNLSEREKSSFMDFLFNHVYLNELRCHTYNSAITLFEALNTRGLPLNMMDKLKVRLMMYSGESEYNKIEQIWEEMEGDGADTAFLRDFFNAEYNDSSDNKIIAEANLYNWIISKEKSVLRFSEPNGVQLFLQRMQSSLKNYALIAEGRLPSGANNYPLLCLQFFSKSSRQHLPLLLASYNALADDESSLSDLSSAIWKTLFVQQFSKSQANQLEPLIIELARMVRSNKDTLAVIRSLRDNMIDPDKQKNFLAQACANAKHNKPIIRHYLAIVTGYIEAVKSSGNADPADSLVAKMTYKYKTSISPPKGEGYHIDHIYPQSGGKDKEAVHYIHKMGNLTVLYKDANTIRGATPFDESAPFYEQADNPMLTRMLTDTAAKYSSPRARLLDKMINPYTKWGFESIIDRTITLHKIMIRALKLTPLNSRGISFANSLLKYEEEEVPKLSDMRITNRMEQILTALYVSHEKFVHPSDITSIIRRTEMISKELPNLNASVRQYLRNKADQKLWRLVLDDKNKIISVEITAAGRYFILNKYPDLNLRKM